MADLYRKSSLERISSPEQLDKALKVSSPLSWIALVAVTLIVVVTVIWSIVGSIPETITTKGVVSSQVGSNAVYIKEAGTVVSVRVKAGDDIHLGDPVLTYKTSGNDIRTVYSDQVGTVSGLIVKNGDELSPGSELVRVTPKVQSEQIIVCYVPLAQAKKLERGMQVNITFDSIDSQSYGHMVARIINIDAYAASTAGMANVLGSGNNLDSMFLQNGAVVAVACELYPDSTTTSGYYWSNSKGSTISVSNGSLVTVKMITDEVAPITKLFSKIGELWGD